MSEGRRNQTTSLLFFAIGLVVLLLATTDVPGSAAFIPIGIVLLLIGVMLLIARRGTGA